MCDAVATSREHVPALCFFPEQKDLEPGIDLRRNLVTVPSCDEHNSQKSKDDEYLWFVISACNGINECGQNMIRTKVIRNIRRRPALINSLMQGAVPAEIFDSAADEWRRTVQVQFESDRVFKTLEQLGRALYFHHFGRKWPGEVAVFPSFALFGDGPASLRDRRNWRRVNEKAGEAMRTLKRLGENQDVFFYQVLQGSNAQAPVMRAVFYGSAAVDIGFLPQQSAG